MRPLSPISILTVFCALTLLPLFGAAGELSDPPGYTVELIWSASDNGEAEGVGTDTVTAIVGDTLTVDVYLNVFDDGATLNSLWSYNLSIEYEAWRVTASNYLPAADVCSGSPPNEVCEEGSAWLKRGGSTIVLLKSAFPSTPPEQDPTNTNTIHYEDGVEVGLVGSTDGQGDGPGCIDPIEQAANDRVRIASVDFTVLRGFDTSEVESVLRPGVGQLPSPDGIFATCAEEVLEEDIDFRIAT
ncbi:MAG: hypothetical protein JRH19_18955, partial [Deltaproteobacteria bacterium]|nr:hypothetical protein [Deltaproteobacteria bacterium]